MTTDKPKGASYILREIPPELWKQVKSRAALDGKPLRALMLEWLASYAATQPKRPIRPGIALDRPAGKALTETREE